MAHRRIIWSDKATDALKGIFEYIAQDSEYQAAKFINQIKKYTENLIIFPKMGKMLERDKLKKARYLIYRKYKIIYEDAKKLRAKPETVRKYIEKYGL